MVTAGGIVGAVVKAARDEWKWLRDVTANAFFEKERGNNNAKSVSKLQSEAR